MISRSVWESIYFLEERFLVDRFFDFLVDRFLVDFFLDFLERFLEDLRRLPP